MARDKKRGRPDEVIKARFDVYLSRDMLFNNPPGLNTTMYSKYTKCEKVPYSDDIIERLNRMEDAKGSLYGIDKTRAVAIELGGSVRFVWRNEVLTEKEYAERIERDRRGVSALRKIFKGNVGGVQGGGQ